MNQKLLPQITAFVFAVFIALGPVCAVVMANGEAETSPVPQQQSQITQTQPVQTQQQNVPDELDMAIRDASDYLNDNIPEGSMIVILNIQSDSAKLSDYIIDELIANAVNDRIFKVIDRQQLDLIRSEQNFQLSGEVDDKLALSIGKFFGARTIVSGRVMQLDNRYRMTIRALDVQTAQVQGQYNRNITAGSTITALMRSAGSSGGRMQTTPTRTTAGGGNTTVTASANAAVNVPEGTTVFNVNNVSTWNSAVNRIRNGGNDQTYIINVTTNVTVPATTANLFGSVIGINVTIQGGGIIAISTRGSLLQIGARQSVVVRGVMLQGHSSNNSAVVRIMNGGVFRMEGDSSITGNENNSYGGGVYVENGGSFILEGGTISGNEGIGGGVYIDKGGAFTIQGGVISHNIAVSVSGGGVYVDGGRFTMQGGLVSDNTAFDNGGGVFVIGGTFAMSGGAISGNTAKGNHVFSIGGGGGVYVSGIFAKTGGSINGNDTATLGNRNTASKQGHAVYDSSSIPARWRNTTAGEDDNTAGYGFWLND